MNTNAAAAATPTAPAVGVAVAGTEALRLRAVDAELAWLHSRADAALLRMAVEDRDRQLAALRLQNDELPEIPREEIRKGMLLRAVRNHNYGTRCETIGVANYQLGKNWYTEDSLALTGEAEVRTYLVKEPDPDPDQPLVDMIREWDGGNPVELVGMLRKVATLELK